MARLTMGRASFNEMIARLTAACFCRTAKLLLLTPLFIGQKGREVVRSLWIKRQRLFPFLARALAVEVFVGLFLVSLYPFDAAEG